MSPSQAAIFETWVNAGGNLIAMRPDADLAGLLGLTDTATDLTNAYLQIDTTPGKPGAGLVNQTIQFHGAADRYNLTGGAEAVATLFSNASTSATNPAVTLRSIGSNGGQAAAFSYDLARSVVYTRQGNPAWAGDERDGEDGPIRSDDMFFGAKTGDVQPDWIDLDKVQIPQADEQQRLLANLIEQMNIDQMPLPRFWYFPRGEKAVVVMTGDDHGTGGTGGQFDFAKGASPAGCDLEQWECVRQTSYIYPSPGISASAAAAYEAEGFEIAIHVDTNCANWTVSSLANFYSSQLAQFATNYPNVDPSATHRTHCIAWSDWATQPKVELAHDIRLDTNYYYWPGTWVANRPGYFTGSGMPMRFADLDGSMIDVYQAATQMTDESLIDYGTHINTLLDNAIGAPGYYGVVTANMHTDSANHAGQQGIINAAIAKGVPVVSARQMLTWLDGRNASSFENLSWDAGALAFSIARGAGSTGLQAMLPRQGGAGSLETLTRAGSPVPFTVQNIKGIDYAVFPAVAGAYAATFAVDSQAPAISALNAAPGATGTATVTWTTDEPATSRVDYGTSAGSLTSFVANAAPTTSHSVQLTGLALGTTYHFRVTSADGSGNTAVSPDPGEAPASFSTPANACPCTIWAPTDTPANPAVNDNSPIETGTKFRSDIAGWITGVRFYKGAANTGTHIGHLWTANGTLLAEATFNSETASGWQQVDFSTPVQIAADTTYIASYHSASGYFAYNPGFFTSAGVDTPPLHALQAGVDGPNGVYRYGASGFPSDGNTANYWVDVTFTTQAPVADTTAPSITNWAPVPGATGVAATTDVAVTFDEPMNAATIGSNSFSLRAAGGGADVPANVTYTHTTATLDPSADLAPSTTYTVTVAGSVADVAGNQLGSATTWSFTTGAISASIVDTTVADFGAGTTGAGTYIAHMVDGEVTLAPTVGTEFDGTNLPSGWATKGTPWATGGDATVGGGNLSVDGTVAGTTATFAPGRSIEFAATFTNQAFQHVGFVADLDFNAPWVVVSTGSGGGVFARSNTNSGGSPWATDWSGRPTGTGSTGRLRASTSTSTAPS